MQDNNNIRVESVNEEQARPSVDEVVNETVPEAEEAPRIPAGKTARPRRTCRRGRLKVRKGCGPLELSGGFLTV